MIIARTPLRISFAGGGSDFAEYYAKRPGFVVSSAIDKYVYITVNRKFDDLISVSYSKTELVESVDELEHNIIRESLKIVGVEKGINIAYTADLPSRTIGTGLGSSSSLAACVLNALYAYVGCYRTAEQLARDACRVEIECLKQPIGKQDQYIAAYGGVMGIQFNADETVSVDPIICRTEIRNVLQNRMLLFFTGMDRVSSDILSEQKHNMPNNLQHLDRMVAIAREMKQVLAESDLGNVGHLLHESWVLKKQLASRISNDRVDEYYARARKAGAIGGKLCGAGGGGFLLLYCEENAHAAVRRALQDLKEMPFEFEPQGSKIIYYQE